MTTKRRTTDLQADDIEKRLEILFGLCREAIPRRFYRAFEDKLFDACSYCRRPLLIEGLRYLIMKYYAGSDLLQEIAICHQCSLDLKRGYSNESRQALQAIYDNKYVQRRLSILFDAEENDDRVALMTSHCSICLIGKEAIQEHFEYTYCENNNIVFYTHPSIVCDKCTLQIYNSLSEQTRDYKRRFFENHFGFPPHSGLQKEPIRDTIYSFEFFLS